MSGCIRVGHVTVWLSLRVISDDASRVAFIRTLGPPLSSAWLWVEVGRYSWGLIRGVTRVGVR